MSEKIVNIGLIGSGFIAGVHAGVLQKLSGVRLAACCDLNPAAAQGLAEWTGCTAAGSIEEVIDASDAVWICTPPRGHREQVFACLDAGKHVYCDKPLAVNLEDGRAIVERAARSDALAAIGFNCRFHGPWMKARAALDSGELGDPLMFYATRMGLGPAAGWRRDPEQLCGMTIESLSHDVDMLRWLLGEVAEVSARTLATDPAQPQFDNCVLAHFKMVSGAMAGIQASWASAVPLSRHGLIGSRGSLMVEGPRQFEFNRVRQASPGCDSETVTDFATSGIVVDGACRHFVDAIRGDVELQIPIAEGLRTLEVCTAMVESAHNEGRPVTLKAGGGK